MDFQLQLQDAVFDLQLFESTDVKLWEIEGQLYVYWKKNTRVSELV